MKIIFTLIGLLVLTITSCNSGSMSVSSYNRATQSTETLTYSKYYTAHDWIIKDDLCLTVVVHHEKLNIPIVYGVQRDLGLLGSSDFDAKGNVEISLWNQSSTPKTAKILRITFKTQTLDVSQTLNAPAGSLSEIIKPGSFAISNFGTEIPVKVYYELDGKRYVATLQVKRKTYNELKAYQ
jgi:hypothetical protein